MIRDEVRVTVPSDARHLRTLRLVTADAASRAGLDASEVDDLRTAVGELAQALMRVTVDPISLTVVVEDGTVTTRGATECGSAAPAPELDPIAALMVDAVSAGFHLEHDGCEATFVVVKRAGGFVGG